jgi:hypothetical protein
MDFQDCLLECVGNPEFVDNWARLRDVHLPTTGIDAMIDEATGHDSDIARLFIADVYELVWRPLVE